MEETNSVSSSESQEIELEELHGNDYNPRMNYDEDFLDTLQEGIEQDGFNSSLLVRPHPNGDGYEVVAGMQRFIVLGRLYENDFEVPCVVREMDDDEAELAAFKENVDRKDLTALEEAWFYAGRVDITHDSEEISYEEYIKEVKSTRRVLSVPSRKSSGVTELSEKINVGHGKIAKRIELLLLPETVQEMVTDGTLKKQPARIIARLRQIPEPDIREGEMLELGEVYSGDNPNIDRLRNEVANLLEEAEERQREEEEEDDLQQQRVNKLKGEVADAKDELEPVVSDAIGLCRKHLDEEVVLDGDDTTQVMADAISDYLVEGRSKFNSLYMQKSEEELSSLKTDLRNRQSTYNDLVESNENDKCPHCGQDVDIGWLDEEIDSLEERIDEIQEERLEYDEIADEFREVLSELNGAQSKYGDKVELLEEAKE